jgi:hypothetical protein
MCMKMQCLEDCLPTKYGIETLYECSGQRVDGVPGCKGGIINKIGTVLPSKYGTMRLKGWLCPYLCGSRLRNARHVNGIEGILPMRYGFLALAMGRVP